MCARTGFLFFVCLLDNIYKVMLLVPVMKVSIEEIVPF